MHLVSAAVDLAASKMARYVFVVRALSPLHGGWVRVFPCHFRTEDEAFQTAVAHYWRITILFEDCVTLDVVRTISFR